MKSIKICFALSCLLASQPVMAQTFLKKATNIVGNVVAVGSVLQGSNSSDKGHLGNVYSKEEISLNVSMPYTKYKIKETPQTKTINVDGIIQTKIGEYSDGLCYVSTPHNGSFFIDEEGNKVLDFISVYNYEDVKFVENEF